MVLRFPALTFLVLLAPAACLQFNKTALGIGEKDAGGAEAATGSDTRPAPTPDAARDLLAPPGDSSSPPDSSGPPPDATPAECTANQLGCSTDGKTTLTCSAQGRWTTGMTCPAPTACSAGACVCSMGCADEPPLQTPALGLVEDLVGGGNVLHLAVNGTQASIRRLDISNGKDTVAKMGSADFTFFALDSDAMGNLIWCSDVRGMNRTGQLVHGTQQLDPGPCTHVRRRDSFVYFLGDNLYRKTLDAGAPRQTVTTEPMQKFEIAGEHLYFVHEAAQEALLKRFPLTDAAKVEVLLRRPGTKFLRLLPDATHVYLVDDGKILRVPVTGAAQAEIIWEDAGADAWAMAQTDTHLYWSTTTSSGSTMCSEAQVLRRAKAGGPATVLARSPGYCGGQLVRVGERLYSALWVGPPATTPTKILRIRP